MWNKVISFIIKIPKHPISEAKILPSTESRHCIEEKKDMWIVKCVWFGTTSARNWKIDLAQKRCFLFVCGHRELISVSNLVNFDIRCDSECDNVASSTFILLECTNCGATVRAKTIINNNVHHTNSIRTAGDKWQFTVLYSYSLTSEFIINEWEKWNKNGKLNWQKVVSLSLFVIAIE